MIFWWPAYRFSAFLRLLTALVSLATAFSLIKYLPKLIQQQPEDELKIYQLQKQVKKYETEIAELKEVLNNKAE